MCIAIIKPAGINLPSFNTIATCFSNNPHGAGFVYNRDGFNYLNKGYTDSSLLYYEMFNQIKLNDVALIHFRYATHGVINKDNCHPFYCCEEPNKTIGKSDLSALVHNGVLNIRTDGEHSDSYCFAKMLKNNQIDNNKIILSNNKIAVLHNNGTVEKYGDWIEHNGCYYSNGTYRFNLNDFNSDNNAMYKLCDCCGTIGAFGFVDTEVGYRFCPQCASNKIHWHHCKNCNKLTTDIYCNYCYLNNDFLQESYFLN